MNFRLTEQELAKQEYRNESKFNDDLNQAVTDLRMKLKDIAAEHSAIWRDKSQTIEEYERLRKAARQDIINEIGIMLANFK